MNLNAMRRGNRCDAVSFAKEIDGRDRELAVSSEQSFCARSNTLVPIQGHHNHQHDEPLDLP